MITTNKKLLSSLLSILIPFVAVSPAMAEDGVKKGKAIEEIIVTSRKRAESLTDVPMSITAVSGDQLAAKAITTIVALPEVASGLTVSTNANAQVSFRVRGLGSETSSETFEQSVPLFIDGMYQGRSQTYLQAMFDIQQVEIVKGTESSLLGKNTSLGAVSLTTRKPGDEFAFNLTSSYEFELDSHSIEGGVDIPLADNMAFRLAAQISKQGGWVKNPIYGEDYPEHDSSAVRGIFQWEPTSDLDVTLLYQHYEYDTLGQPEEVAFDPNGAAAARAANAGYTDFEAGLNYVNAVSDPTFGATEDEVDGNAFIATLNYEINGYTLTSVTTYSDFESDREFDSDLLPGFWANQTPVLQETDQFTQEVRISSPGEDRFNYVAGLFYLTDDWSLDKQLNNLSANPDPVTILGTFIAGSTVENMKTELESYSAFTQLSYDITDQFAMTLGLRHTEEERTADYLRTTLSPGLLSGFVFKPLDGKLTRKEKHFDGSIGLQFSTENILYYGSFSRGTKGGGFVNIPSSLESAEFDDEQAETLEVGAKLDLDMGTVAISLFKTDIEDYQQNLFNGVAFVAQQVPLKSMGAELEAHLSLADGLLLDAQVTYANTENEAVGYETQNSPLWTGNIGLSYTTSLADTGLDFGAAVGVAYKSDIIWNTLERTIGRSPTGDVYGTEAHTLVNGRLSLSSDDQWTVSLIGKNLSNKKYIAYARAGSFTGASNAALGIPRTIALQFTYNYN